MKKLQMRHCFHTSAVALATAALLTFGQAASAQVEASLQGGPNQASDFPAQPGPALFTIEKPAVQVNAQDMEADAHELPANVRRHALADPVKVEAVGKSLAVRAALADEARALKIDQQPEAKVLLRQAQDNVLMNLLLEKTMKDARPSEADLLKYAEGTYKATPDRFKVPAEREASHILIRGDTPASKERIDEIYKELQHGANFGELAFKDSQDPGSAPRFGSLGFFPAGKMVPAFEAALDKLKKPGEYSQPFQTQFGWHIVRLDAVRKAGELPFADVKEQLMEEGRNSAEIDARDTLLNGMMAKVKGNKAAITAFAEKNQKLANTNRPAH